ncbi:MAG: hypothetical protein K9W44_14325 [Candidatus Lokiarchaeota archaeon]|nr:hypothetical protein [Candidatus Harpocratesius repetitus]
MKKKNIIFVTLFLFSIINQISISSLSFVKAEILQEENIYGGYDFSQYYAPINSTLNYSLKTGDSLGYSCYSNYTIREFNPNNNPNTDVSFLNSNYTTFYQYYIVEYNSTLTYLKYDLFYLDYILFSNFTDSEPWTYLSSNIRDVSPIYKDVAIGMVFPVDVNASILLPNNTIPFLVEVKFWEMNLNFSFYYDQIMSFVQNSLNFTVIYNGWNNAVYSGTWNVKGYSSTNQLISIQIEMNRSICLTDDHLLGNQTFSFFEKVDISEPLETSSIESSHEIEFYGGLNLIYRGDLHLSVPEENDPINTNEWTTTEPIDCPDDWENWHEWKDEDYHDETNDFFLFPTMLLAFGVLIGLIILFVIIRAIRNTNPNQLYRNLSPYSQNSSYYGYRQSDVKKVTEIQEKSPKSLDKTYNTPQFCPNCGSSISSVMAQLLQKEGYSFCEVCGEKIEL